MSCGNVPNKYFEQKWSWRLSHDPMAGDCQILCQSWNSGIAALMGKNREVPGGFSGLSVEAVATIELAFDRLSCP